MPRTFKASEPAVLEALKQANEDHRHYGRLRWMTLTIFLAVDVPLFALALHPGVIKTQGFWPPLIGGVVLAVVFALLERRMNRGMERFVRDVNRLERKLKLRSSRTILDRPTDDAQVLDCWVVAAEGIEHARYLGAKFFRRRSPSAPQRVWLKAEAAELAKPSQG